MCWENKEKRLVSDFLLRTGDGVRLPASKQGLMFESTAGTKEEHMDVLISLLRCGTKGKRERGEA